VVFAQKNGTLVELVGVFSRLRRKLPQPFA